MNILFETLNITAKSFYFCHPTHNPMGIAETYQTSFFCPNLTVFEKLIAIFHYFFIKKFPITVNPVYLKTCR